MTTLKRISLVLALGACLAAAGCGGDDEGKQLPRDAVAALKAQLDNIQARLDNGSAGACRDVLEGDRGPNLQQVQQQLDELPDDVDPDVRSALERSFDRLWELIQQRCDELTAQEQVQEKPETVTIPPPETDTETTETVPPPTDTAPPEETLPPDGDGETPPGDVPGQGNGNGIGNGNGNGFGGGGAEADE